MIVCPEVKLNYEDTHHVYIVGMYILFGLTCITNFYVFYCIVYRSPVQMFVYKWYLLLHQVAAFVADVYINFLTAPVITIPFSAGYPTGPLKTIVDGKIAYSLGQFLIVFELSTVIVLFLIRYYNVLNVNYKKGRGQVVMGILLIGAIANFVAPMTVEHNTSKVIKSFQEKYSCFNETLLTLPGFAVGDGQQFRDRVIPLIILEIIFFFTILFYFFMFTLGAIRNFVKSAYAKTLQRKLLFQITLQTVVPLFIVIIPIASMVFVIYYDMFGYEWLNDVVCATGSSFSTISALVLILMNPAFRIWKKRASRVTSQIVRPIIIISKAPRATCTAEVRLSVVANK